MEMPLHRRAGAAAVAVLLLVCGCDLLGGLVGTKIEVKGAQRSLEEQILGAFERVGEEVYLLAGVRAIDPLSGEPTAPPPMTRSERRALEARRRMEFNRDDVIRFKRSGYVGEGNGGVLIVFPEELQDVRAAQPRLPDLVQAIVEEENEDRLVIAQRIVDTNPKLKGEEGLLTVQRVLAAKHRQEAEAGMKLQLPDGTWTTKNL